MYWILFIGTALASWLVSANLKRKFKAYSQIPLGLTGREIAEKMLRDNEIDDVKVVSTEGMLTDHYNPATKTVNLSESVYISSNIAAAAVAAHECGHALQHAKAYAPLNLRSKLVPIVSFSSQWMQWVILAGLLMVNQIGTTLLLVGIILFGLTTLFSFITLPVEIDASRRALIWLSDSGITNIETHDKAKGALKAAAYTYVVAALGSLATLLYYIMVFTGRRN
ncbi:MAG: zinc metallopeptidase [Paludibacteraceae bacterium]|nr:zinc metallopeptidase [Paludibacteraceae bacterium]